MARKVIYFVSQNNEKREVMSSATTWGALKSELGLSDSGMKFVLRETKATLESSEAVLPESDIVILGFPTKNKSGMSCITKEDLNRAIRNLKEELEIAVDNFKMDLGVDEEDDNDDLIADADDILSSMED